MNRLFKNNPAPFAPTTPDSKPKVERPLIILPTYNEADNITQILKAIEALPCKISILVVDDSSPDGTAKIVTGYPSFNKNVCLLHMTGKDFSNEQLISEFSVEVFVVAILSGSSWFNEKNLDPEFFQQLTD